MMRLAGAVLIGLTAPALAELPSEKACGLAAAEKLPAIPGLTIVSVTTGEETSRDAFGQIADAFPSYPAAGTATNGRIFWLSVEDAEVVNTDPDKARDVLIAAGTRLYDKGYRVRVDVTAAGYTAAYMFACIVSTLSEAFAIRLGLVQ